MKRALYQLGLLSLGALLLAPALPLPGATGQRPLPTEPASQATSASKAPEMMVQVPAGPFWMGCNEQVEKKCPKDEEPYHEIYLDAFSIDRVEVTNAEYQDCVRAGKCQGRENDDSSSKDKDRFQGFDGDRQPMIGVSWEDARNYCEWAGKRLPTEAEWEKAARGTDGRIYPWGNEKPDCTKANFRGCRGNTLPVGSKPSDASPYGVLDMAGNTWEWVADWYDKSYYQGSPSQNPKGPVRGYSRVLRGGSNFQDAQALRASYRNRNSPIGRLSHIGGIRCAR